MSQIHRWMVFMSYKMVKKMADLPQPIFMLSTNFTYTHEWMNEPTINKGNNETQSVLLPASW